MQSNIPNIAQLNPAKFYGLVDLIKEVEKNLGTQLQTIINTSEKDLITIDDECENVYEAFNSLHQEVRIATKRHNPFRPDLDQDDEMFGFKNTQDGKSFMKVVVGLCREFQSLNHTIANIVQGLRPGNLILSKKRFDGNADSFEGLQHMVYELQINLPTLEKFLVALMMLDQLPERIFESTVQCESILDNYYRMLLHRHSVDGIEIHKHPIVTDIAIAIYENVDANGEIADGADKDQVSAYTLRKAEVVAKAVQKGMIHKFIVKPSFLIEWTMSSLLLSWEGAEKIIGVFKPSIEKARSLHEGFKAVSRKKRSYNDFNHRMLRIYDLDPLNIKFREKSVLLTAEERFNLQFQNDTIRELACLLVETREPEELIGHILDRKAQLRKYFQDENSFYVCKMGHGNPFTGEAPGSLTVTPGSRPNVNLDEIVGSGFGEVKDFIITIDTSSKFNDLFLATSPSKTTDKSNVLLVGPMGCGKSEILRAVGGDKKSIGVFAQGSDFLTCWKGEAEKNPKRMFEQCIKLQKEARKHVHILIDEIDSVLNDDKGFGAINLTLEFQILMDGVVHYPHLSVWGATNSIERIPMPMIRRFNKVLIVGELSQEDRIHLIRHFVSYMPYSGIENEDWDSMATKLDGATGDVIRKIVDHVWRTKMTWFTTHHRKEAEELVQSLNQGEKFQIARFNSKKRDEFKGKLGNFMKITTKDMQESIDLHLKNIAVHHEIQMAKETYAGAKKFLAHLAQGEIS